MATLLCPSNCLSREDFIEIKKSFDEGVRHFHAKDYDKKVKPHYDCLVKHAKSLIQQQLKNKSDQEFSIISILIDSTDGKNSEEIIDKLCPQVINLIAGGFETTATTLGWILYLLSRNPEACIKIREEIEKKIHDLVPSQMDLNQLDYLNAVIKETQRLYPILWFNIRYSTVYPQSKVGPYSVLPDSQIMMIPFLANRHPDFWEKPDEFWPERYLQDKKPPQTFSFGNGPRRCLGENFANREIQLALIRLISEFDIMPANEIKPIAGVLLHPNQDILITAKLLSEASAKLKTSRLPGQLGGTSPEHKQKGTKV
jgi:cytochrome P450